MKVYCVLGLEYTYGISLTVIPKIYGIYTNRNSAYVARQNFMSNNIENLSINEMEINN